MNRACNVTILCFLLLVLVEVTSYRILLLPVNMISRYSSFGPLAHTLLKRGYNVTMVIGAKMAVPDDLIHSNVEFAFYDMLVTPLSESQDLGKLVYEGPFNPNPLKPAEVIHQVLTGMDEELEQIFLDPTLMAKLESEKYDYAVTDVPNILRLVPYKLGIPYAVMGVECPWWDMTLPYNPSHVPHFTTPYSEVMIFKERARNLVAYLQMSPMFDKDDGREKVADYVSNRPLASYSQINANISLCFRLREVVTDTYRGLPPNVINIGRMLTKRARPLPEKLLSFISGAQDGFIVVSFGSWFSDWPRMIIHNFLEAFARIRNVRVVWKFTIPSVWTFRLPDNVRTFDSIPQNDLLGHPKCRLFITHLGIHGMTESIYHGVPMVGLPLGLDQHSNGALVRAYQYGRTLNIHSFTEMQLFRTIRTVLNGDYGNKTKAASAILKSLPSGSDAAVYWIEHVIKHGGGHLRSSAVELRWWEYLMLDMIGIAVLVAIFVIIIVGLVVECCYNTFSSVTKVKRD